MGVNSCGTTLMDQGVFKNIGAITWDTTVKTSGFTAVSGNGYFCNTTSAAFTVTLPSSPSAGDVVAITDYANTFDTNNITIAGNGSNIQGSAADFTASIEGLSITLIYVDGTQGWLSIDAAQANDISEQALFTVATGGTITTSGDFKIHTFTGPGTFCVSQVGNCVGGPSNVDYLAVAGGGGGGEGGGAFAGGAGGAGGFRTTFPSPGCNAGSFPITATGFPITVGAGGGPGANGGPAGVNGSDSVFSTITSSGGGGGGSSEGNPTAVGSDGGSGGGGGTARPNNLGGSGNTPPVSPPQGNDGGRGGTGTTPGPGGVDGGGGGGGASAVGSDRSGDNGGPGGNGLANSINGSSVTRAGGGGGGSPTYLTPGATSGSGGSGGGGPGNTSSTRAGSNGTTNTGGGGGGGGWSPAPSPALGGNGGSGIVIIRYKFQ